MATTTYTRSTLALADGITEGDEIIDTDTGYFWKVTDVTTDGPVVTLHLQAEDPDGEPYAWRSEDFDADELVVLVID